MPEHPWATLAVPTGASVINARRVDANGKWNFFWARDSDARSLLVLRYGKDAATQERLPNLKGMEVFMQVDETGEPSLSLRLRDSALRDLFYRLCLDIIASTEGATSECEALNTALARTWRWHHLLRGGGTGLLSPEEQKGLIGELLVLEAYFLPVMPASDALAAWRGPLGEAKDFEIGQVAIESKAHGGGAVAAVRVSSEFQLDDSDLAALFLHVSLLDRPTEDGDHGFTLSEVCERIRARLQSMAPRSTERYDALLTAAGFRRDDDYSQSRWTGGERGVYRVRDSFPRLVPATVPRGVANVTFSILLGSCGSFLVDSAALRQAIGGVSDAY